MSLVTSLPFLYTMGHLKDHWCWLFLLVSFWGLAFVTAFLTSLWTCGVHVCSHVYGCTSGETPMCIVFLWVCRGPKLTSGTFPPSLFTLCIKAESLPEHSDHQFQLPSLPWRFCLCLLSARTTGDTMCARPFCGFWGFELFFEFSQQALYSLNRVLVPSLLQNFYRIQQGIHTP